MTVMKSCRLHITGASGSGVTTLGRAAADALAVPHHDMDDYYWQPTIPPYRVKRPAADRVRLMQEMFLGRADWVLSGSLVGWAESIVPLLDAVVFLHVPTALRLERLRAREARHFGADAVSDGGWRHREMEEFLDWAAHYEDDTRAGRTLAAHEAWLAGLSCPVLRLDGTAALPDLVDQVVAGLRSSGAGKILAPG